MKRAVITLVIVVISVGVTAYLLQDSMTTTVSKTPVVLEDSVVTPFENNASSTPQPQGAVPTERYSAQVDRVKVIFEQWDYTRFRLQTNELVRTGALNSERGFGDDPDATVYVLNWDKPDGEQIRYVRLTAEPGYLYALDSNQRIVPSGRLTLE